MAKEGYIQTHQDTILIVLSFVLVVACLAYGYLHISALEEKTAALSSQLASTTASLAETRDALANEIAILDQKAAGISSTLSSTQQSIASTQQSVSAVQSQVGTVSSTVDTLEKLSKTDPELLKKYSKVYFLNENYTPAHLTPIPKTYLYDESRSEQFLTEAWPFLEELLKDAGNDGVTLYIESAYRSFGTQSALKSKYTVTYGAGTANQFSADQGYSEHQLGTTVDFITTGLGGQLDGFENTEAYQWLLANAYKYGFELSYPQNNDYYVFEPWHWRFVGVKLATYLHTNDENFYDLDQRTIDTFLADIFD